MNIDFKSTNFDMTEAIKAYAQDKVSGLEKFGDIMDARIELERDRKHSSGNVFRAELTVHVGGKMLRADAISDDMYASIDLVIPKLKEQLTKNKTKRNTLIRRGARSAKSKI